MSFNVGLVGEGILSLCPRHADGLIIGLRTSTSMCLARLLLIRLHVICRKQ